VENWVCVSRECRDREVVRLVREAFVSGRGVVRA